MAGTRSNGNRLIKWTQWTKGGVVAHGYDSYQTIVAWMRDDYAHAKKSVEMQEKPHLCSGRVMHDDHGCIAEIRMYVDAYLTDEELDAIVKTCPKDTFWVAHKWNQ